VYLKESEEKEGTIKRKGRIRDEVFE